MNRARFKALYHGYRSIGKRYRFLEPLAFLAFLSVLLLVMTFLELAEEVGEGETHSVDTKILMMFRDGNDPQNALGPPWVGDMVRDISGLGGIAILTLVTIGAALYLAMMKKPWGALYLVIVVSVGTFLSNLLKYGYARPRPDLVPHAAYTFTNSFPSGHSMMAAVVYLSVGILLARAHKTIALKLYFILTSIVLTFLIGVSRIYLGVHWPTDVVAGWIAGAVCALFFYMIEWLWQERLADKAKDAVKSMTE